MDLFPYLLILFFFISIPNDALCDNIFQSSSSKIYLVANAGPLAGNTSFATCTGTLHQLIIRTGTVDPTPGLHVEVGETYVWTLKKNLGQTLIALNPLASEALDSGYDSNRLATAISLCSQLQNGSERLGISTEVKKETHYRISIFNTEGNWISETRVCLTDNYLNETIILSDGDCYSESGAGVFEGRFALSFEAPMVLFTNDFALPNVSVVPNPTHGLLNIFSPTGIREVRMYDMQGRTVFEMAGNGLENLEVNPGDMASAA